MEVKTNGLQSESGQKGDRLVANYQARKICLILQNFLMSK